jgi:CrcB protein
VALSTRGPLTGYLAAALGGALGALARWAQPRHSPPSPTGWPWSTLLVNLTGCLLLGLLVAALFARHPEHPWLRPFLGTGFCGSLTTFSTFGADVARLVEQRAVAYLTGSVLLELGAAAVGWLLARG